MATQSELLINSLERLNAQFQILLDNRAEVIELQKNIMERQKQRIEQLESKLEYINGVAIAATERRLTGD